MPFEITNNEFRIESSRQTLTWTISVVKQSEHKANQKALGVAGARWDSRALRLCAFPDRVSMILARA
jgi:hypothetical protein